MSLTIAYRGNFQPDLPPGVKPWSTESHIALSLTALGHTVWRIQEDRVDWPTTVEVAKEADLFLWTSTYGYAHSWPQEDAHAAIKELNSSVPTAAFHLDRFLGLDREDQLATEPWFRVQHVFTADGSDPKAWKKHGVNHHWLPPGVYHGECVDTPPQDQFRSKVAFVGSWRQYGHKEWWPHRKAMLNQVRRWYGKDFDCWPKTRAVRGIELNSLYASVDVVVGDSCLSGNPTRYWSDRIPETLGRGGLLVHPHVDGLKEVHPLLPTYPLGDWEKLRRILIDLLNDDEQREQIRKENVEHTREHHTYAHRMQEMLKVMDLE